MCLSVSVGGVSFCGSDVGGFFGDPSAELLTRWYQAGAYQPFFRAHAHIETKRREPWLFGEPTLTRIREAVRERYQLLPYWYSLFFNYRNKGTPVIRSMFAVYPQDDKAASLDLQYHLGDALLIAPVTKSKQSNINIYLPTGIWYDYHSFEIVTPGEISHKTSENYIPVFIKGGSIVPRQDRQRRSSQAMINDPYTLVIALDEIETAKGFLYADDTSSHNYQRGDFIFGELKFESRKLSYKLKNKLNMNNEFEKIIILGLKLAPKSILAKTNAGQSHRVGFYNFKSHLILKLPNVKINEDWTIIFN